VSGTHGILFYQKFSRAEKIERCLFKKLMFVNIKGLDAKEWE
jgi:hypothetical protein